LAAEELSYVHRFLPATADAAPFTLLLLHGTGGTEEDLLPLGTRLAPGAALLSPRGKVLERGMPRFFRRLSEGVFDLDDLKFRAQELADFISAASASYSLDPAHIYAVGYSNGANIAAALMLLAPEVLAGAVLLRAMVPLIPDKMPDLHRKPVFISAGRRDPIAVPAQAEALAALLTSAGALVTMNWAETGHALEPAELARAGPWLARVSKRPGA
jgi:phospholipase/carboxylesterase